MKTQITLPALVLMVGIITIPAFAEIEYSAENFVGFKNQPSVIVDYGDYSEITVWKGFVYRITGPLENNFIQDPIAKDKDGKIILYENIAESQSLARFLVGQTSPEKIQQEEIETPNPTPQTDPLEEVDPRIVNVLGKLIDCEHGVGAWEAIQAKVTKEHLGFLPWFKDDLLSLGRIANTDHTYGEVALAYEECRIKQNAPHIPTSIGSKVTANFVNEVPEHEKGDFIDFIPTDDQSDARETDKTTERDIMEEVRESIALREEIFIPHKDPYGACVDKIEYTLDEQGARIVSPNQVNECENRGNLAVSGDLCQKQFAWKYGEVCPTQAVADYYAEAELDLSVIQAKQQQIAQKLSCQQDYDKFGVSLENIVFWPVQLTDGSCNVYVVTDSIEALDAETGEEISIPVYGLEQIIEQYNVKEFRHQNEKNCPDCGDNQ